MPKLRNVPVNYAPATSLPRPPSRGWRRNWPHLPAPVSLLGIKTAFPTTLSLPFNFPARPRRALGFDELHLSLSLS
jgi:hypothetical protein